VHGSVLKKEEGEGEGRSNQKERKGRSKDGSMRGNQKERKVRRKDGSWEGWGWGGGLFHTVNIRQIR